MPLVKTLCLDDEGEGEYQFKHLSFQEALVVEAVVEGGTPGAREAFWGDDAAACRRVRKFYDNTLRIGGHRLGEALVAQRLAWDFSRGGLADDDVRRVALVAAPGARVTLDRAALEVPRGDALTLRQRRLGPREAVLVAGLLEGHTSLDLGGNAIGAEGARVIGESLCVVGSLTSLNLLGNEIGPRAPRRSLTRLASTARSRLATSDATRRTGGCHKVLGEAPTVNALG